VNSTLTMRATAALLLALAVGATGCRETGTTCESSALCRDGQLCLEGSCVATLPPGACTPPTSGILGTGALDPGVTVPAACSVFSPPATWPQPVSATTALPTSSWVADLGTHAVGETVTFNVPPGTASVTIHQQGVTGAATFDLPPYYYAIPNSVVPTALRAPNGATVYADDLLGDVPLEPYLFTGYYGGATPWSGSYTLPATSRMIDLSLSGGEVPPGDWSFVVNDWNQECAAISGCTARAAGAYDIKVVARPGPYVATGTLNIGIYLAGGAMSAAAAVGNPGYQRFVWAIGQILGRAGICLGNVTFFDTPPDAPSTPNIDPYPPCSDLARLFSLADPSVDGVHLFLVDDLCVGPNCNTGIVGIDGSIPGPSGLPGAVTSGAAMVIGNIGVPASCPAGRLSLATCGSDFSGYIAAHEIGHWLGLYHTTEATGDRFDPLATTPTCGCAACAPIAYRQTCGYEWGDYATWMHPEWCASSGGACGGGDNLMFWVVDQSISVGNLDREQALVMRVNPAVKP